MFNPSYLIKSRHDIFYFRYPLPCKASSRVSISLKTRCPKEALRLAKSLEYHSLILIAELDLERMNHADIISIMKSYYAEVLDRATAQIDVEGPLSPQKIQAVNDYLKDNDMLIKGGYDDILEALGGGEYEDPTQDPLKNALQKIMDKNDLNFAPDSKEYGQMKEAYKFLHRNYFTDLLAYNSRVMDFSLLDTGQGNIKVPVNHLKPEHRLENVIRAYMEEIKSNLTERSYKEQYDCLNYLTDWLGKDFPITKIDIVKAREVKELLIATPKQRNKSKLTGGKPLEEQIAIAEESNLDLLSAISVNKYLGYFTSLFGWAQNNRYISDNPFTGLKIKANKKKNRRELFTKEEIATIFDNLGNDALVKNKSNYWGALLAIYTGARRNEIAGLLPDDVKQDAYTGIWYFEITDEEEEGKSVKTEAGKRIVPIHSRLIDLGFLAFVEEARGMKGKIKHKNGFEPRLLYDLTFTNHEKWGRNLGRWFNENYLKALGLKSKKKTLHSLRHSLITFLSAAGIDGAHIKSIVGHEANTVTTQTYTHYGVEHLPAFKEAIEKLPY